VPLLDLGREREREREKKTKGLNKKMKGRDRGKSTDSIQKYSHYIVTKTSSLLEIPTFIMGQSNTYTTGDFFF
jgi:hypothetical protein